MRAAAPRCRSLRRRWCRNRESGSEPRRCGFRQQSRRAPRRPCRGCASRRRRGAARIRCPRWYRRRCGTGGRPHHSAALRRKRSASRAPRGSRASGPDCKDTCGGHPARQDRGGRSWPGSTRRRRWDHPSWLPRQSRRYRGPGASPPVLSDRGVIVRPENPDGPGR